MSDIPTDVDLDLGDYCNNDEEEYRMETRLIRLRRAICGILSKCVSIEKSGFTLDPNYHNVLNIKMQLGQELELWVMLICCCGREEIYALHYAHVAESLYWRNSKLYQGIYERCFTMQVALIYQWNKNKLRNVSKFFGHLVVEGLISWDNRFSSANLPKEATNPSSLIFIDILFDEAL